jgi:CNT family concentrative nucleoside transporter
VLAAYALYGIDAGHLLAASVMSAPAALVVAKIIYPETDTPQTLAGAEHDPAKATANVIDAAAAGAADGMRLALNIAAMLMAFIAIIAMLNFGLGLVGGWIGFPELSLQAIFGVVFAPLAWCMGVDTSDLLAVGNLLGTKIALNEFVAFVDLGALKPQMSERSFAIATYALCGFANFSSIGIQIGGLSGIAPERRSDLARIGLKAMLGGRWPRG